MTKQHQEKRLLFATKFKDWNVENWKKVIFCDECSIVLGKRYNKKGWKLPEIETFQRIRKTFSLQYFKIFSFISFKGQGEFIIVNEKWNSEYYIKLIRTKLKPFLSKGIL